jgi:hypothetical protein
MTCVSKLEKKRDRGDGIYIKCLKPPNFCYLGNEYGLHEWEWEWEWERGFWVSWQRDTCLHDTSIIAVIAEYYSTASAISATQNII